MNAGLKLAAALILMGTAAPTAELRKETVQAFDEYVRKTEARLDARVASGDFLWVDDSKQTLDPVRNGQVAIQPRIKGGEMEVPHGLIHDWIGAVFIPGTTLDRVLASVQDYDRNKYTHKPEVIDSKLLARDGNDFRIFLKVRKKKVITVVLNTEHRVHYAPETRRGGRAGLTVRGLRKWTMRANRMSANSRRERITDSCGVCTPTGASKSATAASTWNARRFR
jgi:hypothetical protein